MPGKPRNVRGRPAENARLEIAHAAARLGG